MALLVILSALFAAFSIFFFIRFVTVKKHGIYSQRAIGLFHYPKWSLHYMALLCKQYFRPKRLNNYNMNNLNYHDCGIIPTFSEAQLENPKLLITDRHDDGIFMWGGDAQGRHIVAKVVRLSRNRACINLFLKTENGDTYTLPNQPDSNVVNVDNEQSWQGSGLLLECVEPMRTWRLKFNGFLRRGTREHYVTKSEEDDDDKDFDREFNQKEIISVRLDFLWKAKRAPIDIWKDSSVSLLADSLAMHPGADSSTFEALERDGYDQWGMLHGTVQFGSNNHEEWYLRGGRQHRWGMSDSATNLHRSLNLFMYFENGNSAWIEAFSYKSLISHALFGYLQTASGFYYPITSTNLELADVGEDGEIPKHVCFSFKAGGSEYQCWHKIDKGVKVHSGDPWTLVHDYCTTSTLSNGHGEGWGLAIFSKRFNELCPVPEKQHLSIPKCEECPTDGEYVVDFSDINCTHVPLSGGKGASLACLTYVANEAAKNNLQLSVPDGIVVTSEAWEKQVKEASNLNSCIQSLQKAVTSSQPVRIKEVCKRIEKILMSFKINETIEECVTEVLSKKYGDNLLTTRFAVRSSACSEDSKESSSAGQNETFLGVFWDKGEITVVKSLALCWASQFTYQSVEYKRQRGQPLNDGMCVVIQEMVSPTTAGVLFTRDPVTGSPDSILLSANYGLAESVVSGSSDPDVIRISKSWRKKLKITEKTLGEKKNQCIMEEHGGTKDVEVIDSSRAKICMTDELILQMAKIGIFVEECYGSPRDIEFAIVEDKIYLLQARPITSLTNYTEYELIHEQDSPIISDYEMNTVANTGEVFPGYTCPLTISTVIKSLDIAIQKKCAKREWPKYVPDVSYLRSISTFTSNCFLDFGEIGLRGVESTVTLVNKVIDLAIFGRMVTTPQVLKWAISRFGVMDMYYKTLRTGYSFYEMFLASRVVKNNKHVFSNYDIDTSRAVSSFELYHEICRKLPELTKISESHVTSSSSSTMSQSIAIVMMAENATEINPKTIQDIASLLGCISETESADVPTSLKNLAKIIAADEEADDFLSMTTDEGRVWLESDPEEVGTCFKDFLTKHGHRCIKELDLRSESWGMAPEGLVGTLQTMVRNSSSLTSKRKAMDISKVLDSMEIKLTNSKKRCLKFVLNICGTAVTMREATKSMLIKTVNAFRKAYKTLGIIMVSECRIPDAELIFFFQHYEIGILLATRSASLVAKAINRRKLMKKVEQYKFEEICIGIPKPINLNEELPSDMKITNELQGTPVCHGIAKGIAKVVTNLQDAINIENGDILITYSTDIGWTPFFPLLSGVVTEIGGLVSHGAVVAREYGLPCVVGMKGATKVFKSGDLVLLNGKEGKIQKIS